MPRLVAGRWGPGPCVVLTGGGRDSGRNWRREGLVKLVLVIAVVALAGALLTWLLGGRDRPFSAETTVGAPPAEVFPWLVEPSKLTRWVGGLVESRPLEPAVLDVGARSIEVVEEGGRRSEMTTTVRALEPPTLLEVEIESPMLKGTNRLEVTATAQGSRVRQTLVVRYRGLARFVGPFMGRAVRRKLAEDLERLRFLVAGCET